MKKLSLLLLIMIILLFSCSTYEVQNERKNEETQVMALQVTNTSKPTLTKSPTNAIIPTKTATTTETPQPYLGSMVISTENVSLLKKLSHLGKGRVNTVAWSPDGKIIAFGSAEDNYIHLWNVEKKEELKSLKGHSESVHSVTFSPDGNLLASSTWVNGNVLIWEIKSGKQIFSFVGATLGEPQLAFSPDGSLFAYAVPGASVRIWDIKNEKELYLLGGHRDCVTSLAFSPYGNILASSSENSIMLWDLSTGVLVDTLKLESSCWYCDKGPHAASLCFSPDGAKLASVIHISGGYTVEREGFILWDIVEKEPLINLRNDFENNVFKYYYDFVNFSPDGNLFILDYEIWSTLEVESILTILESDTPTKSSFSPDGKTLAIPMYSTNEGGITLWGIP